MDKLFSNLQNNQNVQALLNSEESKNKINELLEKASQATICGPTCQKIRVTEELKQKYLDAETNIQLAPIELEQSKKNYYIFTEGRHYYDNMLEEELNEKINKISELLEENFNNEVSSANTMNTYLNTALINSENTKELLKEYLEKNKILKVKLRETRGDILTNDRKTYYETDAYDNIASWYKLFWWIYYIVFVMLFLVLMLSPSSLTLMKKIVFIILFMFYPYYINYVVNWVYEKFRWLQSKMPKNVYNNL